MQVFKNERIPHMGELFVDGIIQMLDVIEKNIHMGQKLLEGLPRGVTAAFQSAVDALLFAQAQNGFGKGGLRGRLAATEGKPAARTLVEHHVLQHNVHHFFNAHLLPKNLPLHTLDTRLLAFRIGAP